MSELLLKYNALDSTLQDEVLDFIDFLIAKKMKPNKLDASDYKRKILTASTWSEDDINLINSASDSINNMKIQPW